MAAPYTAYVLVWNLYVLKIDIFCELMVCFLHIHDLTVHIDLSTQIDCGLCCCK